jgi:hypothetical protein
MMLDPVTPVAAEKVESQAVFFCLVQFEELDPETRPLRGVDLTLEHRVLHALPETHARLRDLPQSFPTRSAGGGHVIGDEHEHLGPLISK